MRTIKLNGVDIDVDMLTEQLSKAGYELKEKPKIQDNYERIFVGTDGSIAIGGEPFKSFDELFSKVLSVLHVIKEDHPDKFNRMITHEYNCHEMPDSSSVLYKMDTCDTENRNLVCITLVKILMGKLNRNHPNSISYETAKDWLVKKVNKPIE
jgi:hypothetical protein